MTLPGQVWGGCERRRRDGRDRFSSARTAPSASPHEGVLLGARRDGAAAAGREGRGRPQRVEVGCGCALRCTPSAGYTALMRAAKAAQPDCIRLLLQAGAEPTRKNLVSTHLPAVRVVLQIGETAFTLAGAF